MNARRSVHRRRLSGECGAVRGSALNGRYGSGPRHDLAVRLVLLCRLSIRRCQYSKGRHDRCLCNHAAACPEFSRVSPVESQTIKQDDHVFARRAQGVGDA
jgi:hypothetical protein